MDNQHTTFQANRIILLLLLVSSPLISQTGNVVSDGDLGVSSQVLVLVTCPARALGGGPVRFEPVRQEPLARCAAFVSTRRLMVSGSSALFDVIPLDTKPPDSANTPTHSDGRMTCFIKLACLPDVTTETQ